MAKKSSGTCGHKGDRPQTIKPAATGKKKEGKKNG